MSHLIVIVVGGSIHLCRVAVSSSCCRAAVHLLPLLSFIIILIYSHTNLARCEWAPSQHSLPWCCYCACHTSLCLCLCQCLLCLLWVCLCLHFNHRWRRVHRVNGANIETVKVTVIGNIVNTCAVNININGLLLRLLLIGQWLLVDTNTQPAHCRHTTELLQLR